MCIRDRNPTDESTTKEEAEARKADAETDQIYHTMGAIDGHDVRNNLIKDQDSKYYGLEEWDPDDRFDDNNEGEEDLINGSQEKEKGPTDSKEKDMGEQRDYDGTMRGLALQNNASIESVYQNKPAKHTCLLYTSPSPRDRTRSRMPSSA